MFYMCMPIKQLPIELKTKISWLKVCALTKFKQDFS